MSRYASRRKTVGLSLGRLPGTWNRFQVIVAIRQVGLSGQHVYLDDLARSFESLKDRAVSKVPKRGDQGQHNDGWMSILGSVWFFVRLCQTGSDRTWWLPRRIEKLGDSHFVRDRHLHALLRQAF